MKKVTSWAAIIAVPTLITGWYGMNVPYPGSGETWGVIAAAACPCRLLRQPLPPLPPQVLALTTRVFAAGGEGCAQPVRTSLTATPRA